MKRRRTLALTLLVGSSFATEKAVKRCDRAAALLGEVMATPEQAIPQHLLRRAHCIGLIPGVKKVGLLVGGRYGKRREESRPSNGPYAGVLSVNSCSTATPAVKNLKEESRP